MASSTSPAEKKGKSADARNLGVTAGLTGPPLFMSLVFAQDLLRDDFDPVRRFISELTIGPLGWIQILNFLVSATLIIIFALTVRARFADVNPARRGASLLAVAGGSMFLSGIFVADPVALSNEPSWHGIVHTIFGLIVFTLIPVSCSYFLAYFRTDPQWVTLRVWTWLTVLITVTFWLILLPLSFMSAVWAAVVDWIGVFNRLVVGSWLFWIFLFALSMRRNAINDGFWPDAV